MAFSATIENSLIGSGQSIRLTEGSVFCPIPTDDWKVLRFTFRMIDTDPGVLPAGSDATFFGFCHGTDNPWGYGSTTVDNAYGIRVNSWLSYTAATGVFTGTWGVWHRGSSITADGAGNVTVAHSYNTSKRMCYSLLMTRAVRGGTGGLASYTNRSYVCTNFTTNTDYPDNYYALVSGAQNGGEPAVYNHSSGAARVIDIDEDTYGHFDHVQICNSSSLFALDIHDLNIHVIE